MSKILDATCVGGVVKVGDLPIPNSVIQSQGVASSSGVLLIEGTKKTYVTSNAADIANTIQAISDILTNVVLVLTAHDVTFSGANAATITAITTAKVALLATKESLK